MCMGWADDFQRMYVASRCAYMQATVGLLVAKTLTNATANPFLAGGAGSYNPVLALDVFLVQVCSIAVRSFSLILSTCNGKTSLCRKGCRELPQNAGDCASHPSDIKTTRLQAIDACGICTKCVCCAGVHEHTAVTLCVPAVVPVDFAANFSEAACAA